MFVDLDHFRRVNDTLGHGAGDGLLQGLSGRWSASLRSQDAVSRLDGDVEGRCSEFVLHHQPRVDVVTGRIFGAES